MPDDSCRAAFPETDQRKIEEAAKQSPMQRDRLEAFIREYAPCLRYHLVVRRRLKGISSDVLQEFFLKKILQGNLLSKWDPQKAKLRTFLCTVLERLAWDMIGAENLPPPDIPEPTVHYEDPSEQAWALMIVKVALQRFSDKCDEPHRSVYLMRNIDPLLNREDPPTYAGIAQRTNLATEGSVAHALRMGKRVFDQTLDAVIREFTHCTTDEVAEERGEVLRILGQPGAAMAAINAINPSANDDSATSDRTTDSLITVLTCDLGNITEELLDICVSRLSDLPLDGVSRLSNLAVSETPRIETIQELLDCLHPSLELVQLAKSVVKPYARSEFDSVHPDSRRISREVASVLYLSFIAVGLLRHGKKLTSVADRELRFKLLHACREEWLCGDQQLANQIQLLLREAADSLALTD